MTNLLWVLFGVLTLLAVWIAYAVGKDHGRYEADNHWRVYNSQYDPHRQLLHYKHQTTFWQGKFMTVKHENNILRRKLRRRERTEDA